MAATVKTHLDIFDGQLTQFPAGASLPTSQEDPMYLVGNGTGLDDGDSFFNTTNEVLSIHIGGSWLFIEFTHTP